ncbi:MFS transporter (plasmid) [Deinococcus taeanensis]|nr:MFS transporter [Deinococcus taeanensis]UBV44336.1 MFS transporter [Deinococcus taeanensis]
MHSRLSPAHAPPAAPPLLSAGLILVVVMVAFESMAVSTVLPRVSEDLRGLALYGWASSAFLLSSLFGAVLSGVLADRRGLAASAALALGVFAVGLLIAALAPSMPAFVLGRLVQGLGAGGLGALPFAVISVGYPEGARARMLAAVSSAWLLPALVGPLVASVVADTWSWRAVFWGLLPLLALSAPLCVLPLRGVARAPQPTADHAVLRPALALSLAAGALIEGLRRPDLWALPLAALGLGGAVWSARTLFPRGMWRLQPGLPAALVVRGGAAFAVMGSSSFLPLALHTLRGLNLTQAGWLLSVGGATWTLGSWIQARLEQRGGAHRRAHRVRMSMALLVVAAATTAAGVLGALPLWAAYAGWCLAGLAMGVGYNSNSLFALASVAPAGAGRLSGQLANIEVLMVAVAAGAGGALIARVQPMEQAFTLAFLLTGGGALLSALAAARLDGRGH